MKVLKTVGLKEQMFVLCLILIGSSAILGHVIQNDFSAIDVDYIRIIDED